MYIDKMCMVDFLGQQTLGDPWYLNETRLFEDTDVQNPVVEQSVRGDCCVKSELVAVGK